MSVDAFEKVVNEWKKKLVEIMPDFSPRDVYSADKTGLFFRTRRFSSRLRIPEVRTESAYVCGQLCSTSYSYWSTLHENCVPVPQHHVKVAVDRPGNHKES